jgi:hypothetical protein
MSSWYLHGGFIAFCILLTCRSGMAADVGNISATGQPGPFTQPVTGPSSIFNAPGNPATLQQNDLPTPSLMALPLNGPSLAPDASTTRKFYTLSASLRETYDDNVNTSSSRQASEETELSPSILVNFPTVGSNFTARYTFNVTYYSTAPNSLNNSSSGSNSGGFQLSHDFVAQYTHAFSDRFNFSAAEEFQYNTEPDILQSTGTNFQNGAYESNIFNAVLTAQWTPLISTTTNFSNVIVNYEQNDVGNNQNSVEDTGTQTVSYAIQPKISADLGGIVDNITYETADRGYTTFTGFGGGSWQILPSMSFSANGGATYIEPVVGPGSISPYAALTFTWTLGARSTFTFGYSHEITPSDQIGANGQTSDRLSANFTYAITPRLSCYLQGVATFGTVSNGLTVQGAPTQFEEDTREVDVGFNYNYNSYLSLDAGVTVSGVDFGGSENGNSYTRDQFHIGIRGTY